MRGTCSNVCAESHTTFEHMRMYVFYMVRIHPVGGGKAQYTDALHVTYALHATNALHAEGENRHAPIHLHR